MATARSHALAAADGERARIAGELQDVVAHALSAMTVQAAGARRLALTRPELARAALEAIERSGSEALDELRRLLGLLRCERAEPAAAERRRIARELHDLVAHSMSAMVVQAGDARRGLDRDPGRALEAATRIERTGREALGEMRHLLGVLNAPASLAPQPTLAEIGELVTRARSAGLPTVLELRGERRPLPAGLDLAAYRIVQEGLTNALKHAGRAPTTVTVDWGEATLTLEVRDRGAGSRRRGSGHGLVGMRERVRLYGGTLAAGPAGGGGWHVRAVLPLAVQERSAA